MYRFVQLKIYTPGDILLLTIETVVYLKIGFILDCVTLEGLGLSYFSGCEKKATETHSCSTWFHPTAAPRTLSPALELTQLHVNSLLPQNVWFPVRE